VLTAGHCADGASGARIWFDADLTDHPEYPFGGSTSFEGVPYAHPDFWTRFPNTSDVGVVVLSEEVPEAMISEYGQLPDVGAVDALDRPGRPPLMPIVGYGLQAVKPELMADRIRYQADPMLIEINSANTGGYNLHLSNNPGKGQGTGGLCFGDSGGPAFLGEDDNTVAGVGSFVLNQNCVGAGFYYRVDTPHAQDWLEEFLPAPAGKRAVSPTAASTWGQIKSLLK
jgi:hypothetical protein